MILYSLAFFIPIVSGYILCSLLVPRTRRTLSLFLLKLSLGSGIGIGIFSCSYFVFALAAGISLEYYTIIELLLLIIPVLLLVLFEKRASRALSLSSSNDRNTISSILRVSSSAVLILSIPTFLFISLKYPHGWWDAWAMWNLRARFLFRAGPQWKIAFSPLLSWAPPDYPLLLQASVARAWTYIGEETVLAPMVLASIFTYGTVGLLFSSLSILRGKNKAMLASVCLLGTPVFIFYGTSQCADAPLGLFVLGILVSLALCEKFPDDRFRLLVLAGLLAALAAWTKNEGFLFLLSLFISSLCVILFKRGWKTYIRYVIPFCLGMIAVMAVILYFKVRIAPASYFLADQEFKTIIGKLVDPSRYAIVSKALLIQLINYKNWSIFPILFLLFITLRQTRVEPNYEISSMIGIGVIIAMFVLYCLTYIVTPRDINWHLWSSLHRVLLQIWPSIIFVFFMTIKTGRSGDALQS